MWTKTFLAWGWLCIVFSAISYVIDKDTSSAVIMIIFAGACFLTAIAIKE